MYALARQKDSFKQSSCEIILTKSKLRRHVCTLSVLCTVYC